MPCGRYCRLPLLPIIGQHLPPLAIIGQHKLYISTQNPFNFFTFFIISCSKHQKNEPIKL